jgi:hypothetical protein
MSEILAQMGGAFRDPGFPETLPNPTALPPGMVVPGNINLQGRPIRLNADGTVSTELSTSFMEHPKAFGSPTNRGEILVPTVVNGRFLTPEGDEPPLGHRDSTGRYQPSPEERAMWIRAQERYRNTGEHMGIFADPESANAYATQAHKRPMNLTPPVYMYHPFDNPAFANYIQSIRKRLGMGGQ